MWQWPHICLWEKVYKNLNLNFLMTENLNYWHSHQSQLCFGSVLSKMWFECHICHHQSEGPYLCIGSFNFGSVCLLVTYQMSIKVGPLAKKQVIGVWWWSRNLNTRSLSGRTDNLFLRIYIKLMWVSGVLRLVSESEGVRNFIWGNWFMMRFQVTGWFEI